jgi:hypothetical protein
MFSALSGAKNAKRNVPSALRYRFLTYTTRNLNLQLKP